MKQINIHLLRVSDSQDLLYVYWFTHYILLLNLWREKSRNLCFPLRTKRHLRGRGVLSRVPPSLLAIHILHIKDHLIVDRWSVMQNICQHSKMVSETLTLNKLDFFCVSCLPQNWNKSSHSLKFLTLCVLLEYVISPCFTFMKHRNTFYWAHSCFWDSDFPKYPSHTQSVSTSCWLYFCSWAGLFLSSCTITAFVWALLTEHLEFRQAH